MKFWQILILLISSCFLIHTVACENAGKARPTKPSEIKNSAETKETMHEILLNLSQNNIVGNDQLSHTNSDLHKSDESSPELATMSKNSDNYIEISANDARILSSVNDKNSGNVLDAGTVKASEEKKADNIENERQIVNENGLPDIREIPPLATVTELPLVEVLLEPTRSSLDAAIIIDGSRETHQEHENRTVDILENSNESIQKDEQIIKINDSGGGEIVDGDHVNNENIDITSSHLPNTEIPTKNIKANIPIENIAISSSQSSTTASTATPSTTTTTTAASITNADIQANGKQQQQQHVKQTEEQQQNITNATVEEVPIPVFSEWAQKQMEEAEKQQALEQEVVNTSTHKKNNTNGNGKALPLKIRAKNYASPDCGSKIIASNSDASNTDAVLSSSSDEYMLSPCGNRIWFVVELCEAIQAQKVDLANFELFSSSPKNFTVAVANRFPTRDWSNVGRFIAEDKRTVQSFELHPHLFGKFVRVDIHSHYSKEHFCPLSLFRVFGTSEFEALETENQPNDDLDDFDDEFAVNEQLKNAKTNLFKSASDAVLSIVKKAAEVLVKPSNNENHTITIQTQTIVCRTPAFGQFNCADCSNILIERINNALSCELTQLNSLINVQTLRKDLLNTQICAKNYGIDILKSFNTDCLLDQHQHIQMDVKHSYFLNILPTEYIGALCQLLSHEYATKSITDSTAAESESQNAAEKAFNLTIDKKMTGTKEFNLVEKPKKKKIIKTKETSHTEAPDGDIKTQDKEKEKEVKDAPQFNVSSNDRNGNTDTAETQTEQQIQQPPFDGVGNSNEAKEENAKYSKTTKQEIEIEKDKIKAPDVNIFNVPKVEEEDETEQQQYQKQQQQHPVHVTDTTTASSAEFTENNLEAPDAQTETTTPMQTITETTTPSPTIATPVITSKSEEDLSSWENFDNLLSTATTEIPIQHVNGNGGPSGIHTSGINLQHRLPSGPQSESVFIRLSNRIKALERNMSLSGQYLEELSRRYKKQVEELNQALTQQAQIVRTLEDQNQHHVAMESLFAQRHIQLKDKLDEMTLQLHACIFIIIFIGAFMFLMLIVGVLIYRSLRRDTNQLISTQKGCGLDRQKSIISGKDSSTKITSKDASSNTIRRKSYDDATSACEKHRRPSEEAMLILKGSDTVLDAIEKPTSNSINDSNNVRQRKISICYGSNTILNGANGHNGGKSKHKRKGEKNSWAGSTIATQPPWQRVELLDFNPKSDSNGKLKQNNNGHNGGGKSRKKSQNLKRHESAPGEFISNGNLRLNVTAPADLLIKTPTAAVDYNESLRLEDDDLNNFIPNTDLAYNEFMPEGPSGYLLETNAVNPSNGEHLSLPKDNNLNLKNSDSKKKRRLSSPNFFKSPFSKSLKLKPISATSVTQRKATTPHEPTSWEWYRLRKTETDQQEKRKDNTVFGIADGDTNYLRNSPAVSVDSSSLSEINFPTNSTENSFRILEEAILSSGEGGHGISKKTMRNDSYIGEQCSNSSGSGSNRSSSSTNSMTTATTKKKNRSFNKIFRKVF